MIKTRRIGLYVGLAILANQATADAQTPPGDPTQPAAGAQVQPGAGAQQASPATRDDAAPTTQRPAARRRPPASSYYNRVTSTSRRSSGAEATPRGTAGAYGANDPLRPYSAQARQSAGAISSTRQAEAPPPPRAVPQSRYNYYPGMRISQHPNANTPQRRCTPSRGGVMGGSMGGGAMMGGGLMGGSLGGGAARGGGRGR